MKKTLDQSFLTVMNTQYPNIKLTPFYPIKHPYFSRVYQVDTTPEKLEQLKNKLPIINIERVYRAKLMGVHPTEITKNSTGDRFFPLQWGLHNQGQYLTQFISSLNQITTQGNSEADIRWIQSIKKIEQGLKKTPTIAVVDMGIDYNHPELREQILTNPIECDENGKIDNSNLEDRDQNGVKGDCIGWNFTANSLNLAKRPFDDTGHGTHVSGIIAAKNNTSGITGVSDKIKILPIKVTGRIDTTADSKKIQPLSDRIAKGIIYATKRKVDVINLSLGWTKRMNTKYLVEAIRMALDQGIIIVAAAGNNNTNADIYPCSYFDVICVGSVNNDGTLSSFSNYGGQVDVLAPGEQIISTVPGDFIPQHTNFNGYDYMSGTSQSAPMVSALAALIKANYPDMQRDEIIRRITDSAHQKHQHKKSLYGIINFDKAFTITQAPSVKPIFKNFDQITYDFQKMNFTFPLLIKNFGHSLEKGSIKVETLSPQIEIEDRSFNLENFDTGKIVNLPIRGRILDRWADNEVQIKVTVSGADREIEFFHQVYLARQISKDPRIRRHKFFFKDKVLPIATRRRGFIVPNLSTVERLNRVYELPEYYLKQNLEDGTLQLYLFKFVNGDFYEVPEKVVLPHTKRILNFIKHDFNFDQVDDYLIRTVSCKPDCTSENRKEFIQMTFLDSGLRPLYTPHFQWIYRPSNAQLDISSMKLLKQNHPQIGTIGIPFFLAQGTIPENSQTNSFWEPQDRSSKRRLYYLLPEFNEAGEVELETHVFTTNKMVKQVKDQFAHYWDEQFALLGPTESLGENQNSINLLVSIGNQVQTKKYLVSIKDIDQFEVKPQDSLGLSPLKYDQRIKTIRLRQGGRELKTNHSFVGYPSSDSIQVRFTHFNNDGKLINSGQTLFRADDKIEIPYGHLASFIGDKKHYTFFQTANFLKMVEQNDSGQAIVSQKKLHRFNFLPGRIFNQIFYPVLLTKDDQLLPGLYVDASLLNANHISITTIGEKKLVSPIVFSTVLPNNCIGLNPYPIFANGSFSYALLCQTPEQLWQINFLKLED
jgi:hypothetical protein